MKKVILALSLFVLSGSALATSELWVLTGARYMAHVSNSQVNFTQQIHAAFTSHDLCNAAINVLRQEKVQTSAASGAVPAMADPSTLSTGMKQTLVVSCLQSNVP